MKMFPISSEIIFQSIAKELDKSNYGKVVQVCKEWNMDYYLKEQEMYLKERYICKRLPRTSIILIFNGLHSISLQTELNVNLMMKCLVAVEFGNEMECLWKQFLRGELFDKNIDDERIKKISVHIAIDFCEYLEKKLPQSNSYTYCAILLYLLKNVKLFKNDAQFINAIRYNSAELFVNAELEDIKHRRKIKMITKEFIHTLNEL